MKKIVAISIMICVVLGFKPLIYTGYCKNYVPKSYDKTDSFYHTCLYKSNIHERSDDFYEIIYNLPIQTHSTMEYLINHAISHKDYNKANELMIQWETVDEVDKTFNSFYYIDKAYRTPAEKNRIFQTKINYLLKIKSSYQEQIVDFYRNWLGQHTNEEFYKDSLIFLNTLRIQ